MGVIVLPARVVKRAVQSAIKGRRRPKIMEHYGEGRVSRLMTELLDVAKAAELRAEPRLVGVTLEELGLIANWLDT